ncbi:MAG: VanZ family protein [Oscillospiraceae bacterium]|nr:VanZ family protein [Oscillospiraceae bacterium]
MRLARRHGRKSSLAHEISLALFTASVVWIVSKTIFPPWDIANSKPINIRVFYALDRSWREWLRSHSAWYFVTNVLGNVALFVPFGFLLPLSMKIKQGFVILYGFVFSLAIEIAQYPLGRWSDIDDLWLNTLGAVIGLLLYTALRFAAPKFSEQCKIS